MQPAITSTSNIKSLFRKASNVFIIGIGGIGASALARWLKSEGKKVFGSDAVYSKITEDLRSEGIGIFIGHSADNIIKESPEIIVASLAVPDDNPEIIRARERSIPILKYPEALGALSNDLDTIAVSGTNGKSTTTALLGLSLLGAMLDPTILVGSIIREIGNNFKKGNSQIAVIEACEYKRAFLNYTPSIGVITNIEADHLDYYKSLEDIIGAFTDFALNIKKGGRLIINGDDKNCRSIINVILKNRPDISIVRFGKDKSCEFCFSKVRVKNGKNYFSISEKSGPLIEFYLQIPGEFNIYNATAVFAAARAKGASIETTKKTFQSFTGIWRRFERVGEYKGNPVISDYAHHPSAVEKTIAAAGSFYPKKRIVAVFQPHQHNRTRMLFDDFVKCFDGADVVIISEIYAVKGRISEEDRKINSQNLISAMKDRDGEKGRSRELLYARDLAEAGNLIRKHAQKNDCILIMGAGDIGELPEKLI